MLIACAVLGFCCLLAQAKYDGGDGSAQDPYRISTAQNMNEIGTHPNDWDKHFVLTADIDLSSYTGTEFNRIYTFTGVFDGRGHTITGFTWTDIFLDDEAGLFCTVGGEGQIQNLTLQDVDITTFCWWGVGALAGWNAGTISNCHVTGSITGGASVGGLVGYNNHDFGPGQIVNCSAEVTISEAEIVGGLVGQNAGGTIVACWAVCNVHGNMNVGGLVAANQGTVTNCYATGSVSNSWPDLGYAVGGLIGANAGKIMNCYAAAVVSGYDVLGGLVGTANASGSTFTACFWNKDLNPLLTGVGNITDPPEVVGESTTNMQLESTYTSVGWDFVGDSANGTDDIWMIREMVTYPLLVIYLHVDCDAPSDPGPGNPNISDPLENGSPQHPFDTIQEAIDVARDGDIVLVQPGLYLSADPEVEEQINFGGKNITLKSNNPADPNIVDNTVIGGTVLFDGTEDISCMLTGFTIRNVGYGRIFGNGTQATISHCNISGNGPCLATVIKDCDGTISNCLITDNTSVFLCGIDPVVFGCHGLIKNCTIANNVSGVSALDGGTMAIENCIIYNNNSFQLAGGSGATLNVSYCDIQGGAEGIAGDADVNWGPGNIDADPCFVRLGHWDYNNSIPFEFTPGNYHLKSEGWRCDTAFSPSRWTYDYVTSRCIEAGNPGCALGNELMSVPEDPNNIWGKNIRLNMGYYGDTVQASIAPHGWALLADLTNDGIVGYLDLTRQVEDWLTIAKEQPGDLNRDGVVNMVDFAALAEDWLLTTGWAE